MAGVQSTLSLPILTDCPFTKPQNKWKNHSISSKNVQGYGTQLISTINSNQTSSTEADTVLGTQDTEIKGAAPALKELIFQ